MSTSTQQSGNAEVESNDVINRLVRAAGSYLGEKAGKEIPRREVVLQAEANGYSEREAQEFVPHQGTFRVPEQGDIFGELWAYNPSPALSVENTIAQNSEENFVVSTQGTQPEFQNWLQSRILADDYSHTYTRREGTKRFAKGKDVDRYFSQTFEEFTTVLITYTSENPEDYFPQAVTRKRRRILKGLDAWDDFAGCATLAPKKNGDTHAHEFYWIPGTVEADEFHGLVDLFLKHADGSEAFENPYDEAVKARNHQSREVRHNGSQEFSSDDAVRGNTTCLPQELGANLPMLECHGSTVLDAPRYIGEWAEEMGKGATRFKRFGKWNEYAGEMKVSREALEKLQKGVRSASVLREIVDSAQGLHSSMDRDTTKFEFTAYSKKPSRKFRFAIGN